MTCTNKKKRLCCALNCQDSGLQDLKKLFRFPKDTIQKQKWLENLGLKRDCLRSSARSLICRRHFLPMCLAKKRLHPWALPTLHLGTGKEGIHQPIPPFQRRSCCIKNCNTKSPAILHLFPKQPESRAKWLELCGLKDKRKKMFICRRHFRPSFKLQIKLKKDAYPELNLCIEANDPLQESIDKVDDYYSLQQIINKEDNDPLQECVVAQQQGAKDDTEEERVKTNCILGNRRSSSNSTMSSSEIEEDEEKTDTEKNQDDKKNCEECLKHKNRCRKLREENTALRKKIIQLEKKLFLHIEDGGEEYLWMLLK